MSNPSPYIGKALSAFCAGTLILAAPLGAVSAAEPATELAAAPAAAPNQAKPDRTDRAQQWQQRRLDWVRAKLDRDANRLEITASQQQAWQAYADARSAMAQRDMRWHLQSGDAAAIVRWRAQRSEENARKLATLADATAKLQVVLSPQQRKVLDEVVRRGGRWHGRHGGHGSHGGWHHGRGRDSMHNSESGREPMGAQPMRGDDGSADQES